MNGYPTWGTPGSGFPDPAQEATQSLLADRFKLKIHPEMRDMDVYALALAKPGTLGPGLTPSTNDCKALADQARQGKAPPDLPIRARRRAAFSAASDGLRSTASGCPR